MPKVSLTRPFSRFTGTLDDLVYRNVNGQTIVSAKPEPTDREPTPAQLAQRDRFRRANEYAKEVLADVCQRRVYEVLAARLKRRADKLLTSDFLTPPVVELIELSSYHGVPGDRIRVVALDEVAVVSVHLSIQTAAGTVLEQGPATEVQGVWVYRATLVAPPGEKLTVVATAKDRPGNVGQGTAVYA